MATIARSKSHVPFYACALALSLARLVRADEPPRPPVGPATVYVKEEWSTAIGIAGTQHREFQTRRDIAVCHVSYQDGTFTSDERLALEVGIHEPDGKWAQGAGAGGPLHANFEYKISSGLVPPLPFPSGFSAYPMRTGIELYFLPMLRDGMQPVPKGVDEAALFSTKGLIKPELNGVWLYRFAKLHEAYRVSGPYFLHTADNQLTVSGHLDHNFRLNPIRVLRLSGDAICRVKPGSEWFQASWREGSRGRA